ncbi:NAD(P)H-dependent oxidoreductase [Brenneria sp. g21c3]|uniref:NAD(P)H-dependent oxidoreductase n=1 Tax=Brenneria sp. g21c3 TaxID=3093893 RepID=UPI002EABF9F5|nr:NAD(P)H-dependent oxidoreductase [Brenneria sp. g21c3]
MNVLIILAHPERQSFNAHLSNEACDTFRQQGHQVRIIDLYQDNFDPCEGDRHYLHGLNEQKFDAMQEQRHHWNIKHLPGEVQRHIDLLLEADMLILQFPFWWFGAPAILKGWMDRVFVYGGLYDSRHRHENGVMRGKRALLSVTAGTSANACAHNGRDGDMRFMLWPVMHALHYIGYTLLEPFLVAGIRGGLQEEQEILQRQRLARVSADYREKLDNWAAWPEIPFNSKKDFGDDLLLKPEAPEYSPFVRHDRDAWRGY